MYTIPVIKTNHSNTSPKCDFTVFIKSYTMHQKWFCINILNDINTLQDPSPINRY